MCGWGGGDKEIARANSVLITRGKSGDYDNCCSGSNWIDSCDSQTIVAETQQVGGSVCYKKESRK